ncbi:MAG: hypothetical protein ACXVKP_17100 [Ilumatobacteraceae bacterium]
MSADTIANLAKLAWEVITDGKPSADIFNSTANAVPQVEDWQSLTETRGPNSYRMFYHRAYLWPFDDCDHVQLQILLKWEFGARYKGGGAFIPNIWVEVPECFVGFGWDANISFAAQQPTNAGSDVAPHARIPVTLMGTVSSGSELHHVEWGFVLFGSGAASAS